VGVAGIALLIFCSYESPYMKRFKEHFGWYELKGKPSEEVISGVKSRLLASCRGQMISGALRAWKEKPLFGICPGMHQNLWPHFAASPDGDRERAIWPTFRNDGFHSYEVHSDWVQLVEEYGVFGLLLFMLPMGVVVGVLLAGLGMEAKAREKNEWRETGNDHVGILIGGLLACACMVFHSLGDFNLQMPATVWMFAAIVALSMAYVLNGGRMK
jgi:O-antigen ligase